MEPELSTSTTIELSISCRGLCDMDLLSKSDPLVVVFEKSTDNTWKELGRTEVIQNTLNPDFAKMIMVEYHFEEQQRLNFAVYDVDCSSDNLKNQDFLGHCEATLGEIASSRKIVKPLKNGPSANCGTIMIVAEEVSSCKDELILDISGQSLDKKDLFGTSDPFLAFYRVNEDGSRTVVHRTEEIRNTLNPNWKQMVIPTRILVNGDHDRPLVVSCLDWNRSGRLVVFHLSSVLMFLFSKMTRLCTLVSRVCAQIRTKLCDVQVSCVCVFRHLTDVPPLPQNDLQSE
ncbi:hypothetical protein P879_11414 [Paragonimus westermani]|uniref:C2 domain-containing protein n=1 Tax=Paragonimus westermani TaxID=34504 RepID=A0A8T0D6V9_9TREM|nr:hypothetical protein P879_11414 [Paragonimus westermani]